MQLNRGPFVSLRGQFKTCSGDVWQGDCAAISIIFICFLRIFPLRKRYSIEEPFPPKVCPPATLAPDEGEDSNCAVPSTRCPFPIGQCVVPAPSPVDFFGSTTQTSVGGHPMTTLAPTNRSGGCPAPVVAGVMGHTCPHFLFGIGESSRMPV